MYEIFKMSSSPTVDFAAEELKKYLRMMMTECGEIPISYEPNAKRGHRIGLMSDLGLDMSDAGKGPNTDHVGGESSEEIKDAVQEDIDKNGWDLDWELN